MKRIGYIGLSTPTFYDYRNPASKSSNDLGSSPNPIVEGAFGAMLLYDELWFLCKSLCPENMRNLPYVKFLDEMGLVPQIDLAWLPKAKNVFDQSSLSVFYDSSKAYDSVKETARINWDAAADNHTHGLKVGDLNLNGNSWDAQKVIFDMTVVERLRTPAELVTNSFTSRLFKTESSVRDKLVLSEVLVLDSVPQYLSPKGPYHEALEEVRNSPYLQHFRDWIKDQSTKRSFSEIREVKREVEDKLAAAQREVFLKHLESKSAYLSVAETVVGFGLDALVPGIGALKDIADLAVTYREEQKKEGLRWQGFIVQARERLSPK